MGGLVKGFVGEPLLLNLRLVSRNTGKFPQVVITDDAGVTVTTWGSLANCLSSGINPSR